MLDKILKAISQRHQETGGHNGLSLSELLEKLKKDLTDEIRIALITLEHQQKIRVRETKSGYSFFLNEGK